MGMKTENLILKKVINQGKIFNKPKKYQNNILSILYPRLNFDEGEERRAHNNWKLIIISTVKESFQTMILRPSTFSLLMFAILIIAFSGIFFSSDYQI